jgi:hypothetical protein
MVWGKGERMGWIVVEELRGGVEVVVEVAFLEIRQYMYLFFFYA